MTSASYALRLRFHFCGNNTLNTDKDQIEFQLDGHQFRPTARGAMKDTNVLCLSCGGFSWLTDATDCGERMRSSLSLCGALLKRGIDVGTGKKLSAQASP
jgi:hypothetical protein